LKLIGFPTNAFDGGIENVAGLGRARLWLKTGGIFLFRILTLKILDRMGVPETVIGESTTLALNLTAQIPSLATLLHGINGRLSKKFSRRVLDTGIVNGSKPEVLR
jgi:hypothetical protein